MQLSEELYHQHRSRVCGKQKSPIGGGIAGIGITMEDESMNPKIYPCVFHPPFCRFFHIAPWMWLIWAASYTWVYLVYFMIYNNLSYRNY